MSDFDDIMRVYETIEKTFNYAAFEIRIDGDSNFEKEILEEKKRVSNVSQVKIDQLRQAFGNNSLEEEKVREDEDKEDYEDNEDRNNFAV